MTPDELREWRKATATTQQRLADLCGVTVRQVKRWEAGDNPVPRLLELYIAK